MIIKNIPKILYKYRNLFNGNAEKILSDGEIYFANTEELSDKNEKASFILTQNIWVKDENNALVSLSPEQAKQRLMTIVRCGKNEPYGILSLCDSKTEVQMYREYADNFCGICIGFDWEKFDLRFAGSYPPVKNFPSQVIYQAPIEINFSDPTSEQWLEIYHSKLLQFSYEKEWRMFYTAGRFKHHSVRYAIKEIIFGHEVSFDKVLQIKQLVADLSGIDFFVANMVDNQIKIEKLIFTNQPSHNDDILTQVQFDNNAI